MNERQRLPNRRFHEVIEFDHDGLHYTAGVGRYADGRIGEVFLDADKIGSGLQTAGRDGAIFISMLLQLGCPLDELRHSVTRLSYGIAGGPHGTLLDLIASSERRPACSTAQPENAR